MFFGLRIDGRKTVVEDQDRRMTNQATGKGRALFLPAGKRYTAFSNECLELIGKSLDGGLEIRRAYGLPDPVHGSARFVVGDVVLERFTEQERGLGHECHLRSQLRKRVGRNVVTIDENSAWAGVYEPHELLQ